MEMVKFLRDARDCFVGGTGENRSSRALPVSIATDSPQHRFDNAARSFAFALSRREALSAMLAGFAGVLLSQFGVKTAWAALCTCGSVTYDTLTQCCVGGTVIVPKYPVRDLAACPNRVPHPGFVCDRNGCGPRGGPKFPSRFGLANFGLCCNDHDCCYSTCKSDKGVCDSAFLLCVTGQCINNFDFPSLSRLCRETAVALFGAVSVFGGPFYRAGQAESCDCCEPQTCGGGTGGGGGGGSPGSGCTSGGVCGSYRACGGFSNCFCATTTEGRAACVSNDNCPDVQPCSTSSSCPSGSVCIVNNCCGFSACARPCAPPRGGGGSLPNATVNLGPVPTMFGH